MSSKDYILIAKIIDSIDMQQSTDGYKESLVSALAKVLKDTNGLFSTELWWSACYRTQQEEA